MLRQMTLKEYKVIHFVTGIATFIGFFICSAVFIFALLVDGTFEFELFVISAALLLCAYLSYFNIKRRA